jgi:osmotically-inducible protein OsmY
LLPSEPPNAFAAYVPLRTISKCVCGWSAPTWISLRIRRALELRGSVPHGVQAAVRYGHVNLSGKVNWLFQKHDAEAAVRHIRGVRNVSNHIVVAPYDTVRDVRRRIVTALHQNADVDARHIAVSVSGGTVTLTGTVGTWLQRESAEHAAANAPGISHVDNHIVVEPSSEPEVDSADEIC